MKNLIKKYYGLAIFYIGVIVLTLSVVNYLEQKSVAVDTTHTTQNQLR